MIPDGLPTPEELASAQAAFTLLVISGLLMTVVTAIATRRSAKSFAPWAWGGVAFILSQVIRLPILAMLSALIIGTGSPDSLSPGWFAAVVLASLTAGLFEEGSRALILSRAARSVRTVSTGVAFGVGHAGVEIFAVLIAPSLAALLIMQGVADQSIFAGLDAAGSTMVAQAAQFLAAQTVGVSLLAIAERLLAITLHVVLALMVMNVVAARRTRMDIARGLALPVALHAMANLLAVVAGALFGAFIAEIALALFVGGAVWYYRRNAVKALDSVPPTAPAQS